jgi:hypothetical protein
LDENDIKEGFLVDFNLEDAPHYEAKSDFVRFLFCRKKIIGMEGQRYYASYKKDKMIASSVTFRKFSVLFKPRSGRICKGLNPTWHYDV